MFLFLSTRQVSDLVLGLQLQVKLIPSSMTCFKHAFFSNAASLKVSFPDSAFLISTMVGIQEYLKIKDLQNQGFQSQGRFLTSYKGCVRARPALSCLEEQLEKLVAHLGDIA